MMLATLLKARQDLGHFPASDELHADTVTYMASQLGLTTPIWLDASADTDQIALSISGGGSETPFRHALWRRGRGVGYARPLSKPPKP